MSAAGVRFIRLCHADYYFVLPRLTRGTCSILWEEGHYVSVCLVSNFEKFPMYST